MDLTFWLLQNAICMAELENLRFTAHFTLSGTL